MTTKIIGLQLGTLRARRAGLCGQQIFSTTLTFALINNPKSCVRELLYGCSPPFVLRVIIR